MCLQMRRLRVHFSASGVRADEHFFRNFIERLNHFVVNVRNFIISGTLRGWKIKKMFTVFPKTSRILSILIRRFIETRIGLVEIQNRR